MTSPKKKRQRTCFAKGVVRQRKGGGGELYREACSRFDVELFNDIRAYAQQKDCSFSEAVRILCEIGLETLRLEKEKGTSQ